MFQCVLKVFVDLLRLLVSFQTGQIFLDLVDQLVYYRGGNLKKGKRGKFQGYTKGGGGGGRGKKKI